ncbi:MAG: hypothetical protein KatS3mg115_1182 [Candidatus Poribacteria bacterium]|nr:MAG: hypothetical protein KatS3mg115_1182 [Candidatus Poribacteria bacterium]
MRHVALLLGIAVALTWGLTAQSQQAESAETGFRGTVQSVAQGSPPVEGALIQYTGTTDSGEVTTSATGEFEVLGISPGTYLLTVSAEGFKTRQNIPVTVVAGAVTPIEIKLRPKETLVTFAAKFGWVGNSPAPLLDRRGDLHHRAADRLLSAEQADRRAAPADQRRAEPRQYQRGDRRLRRGRHPDR